MRSEMVNLPVRRIGDEGRRLLFLLGEEDGPDAKLEGLMRLNPLAYVCGGYARWCVSPRDQVAEPTDVDLFCREVADFGPLMNRLHVAGLEVASETQVAVKMKEHPAFPIPVQVIRPFESGTRRTFGDLPQVLDDFDLTVARVGLLDERTAMADSRFEEDELAGLIRWAFLDCPIGAVLRAMKYARKGYRVHVAEVHRLFLNWTERAPEYRDRLGELLRGIGSLDPKEIDELEMLLRVD